MIAQGHPSGHEVHSGPVHALDASCHPLSQPQVAGVSEHGQQDRHLLCAQPLQTQPQEDLHWAHGGWLRLLTRLLS